MLNLKTLLTKVLNEIKQLNSWTYVELHENNVSSSSGTIPSASIRIRYNKNTVFINYYIRVQNSNGRPTLTINNFPALPKLLVGVGDLTLVRIGSSSNQEGSDHSIFQHVANESTATVTFYNYIGNFPSGTGYVVTSGSLAFNL